MSVDVGVDVSVGVGVVGVAGEMDVVDRRYVDMEEAEEAPADTTSIIVIAWEIAVVAAMIGIQFLGWFQQPLALVLVVGRMMTSGG